jgi:amidase
MVISVSLAMNWDDWQKHDAIGLAGLVRSKQVNAKELCVQAAAAAARIDPKIEAVLRLYEDVLVNPETDKPNRAGRLYGVPMFLKDIGSGLAGREQEPVRNCSEAMSSWRPIL